ncbi:Homeodomain protein [Pseudocohnilembus persalinus]|uniref:Homeodomain protein n=1 Tax=Pseudocohnilembus persalinus TaxID=266149 RepID=A0A0V0Q8H4_PSEPJ|nr:Homeodomain protein [Pseudocohnilembus persalinus]|eukprot:KRW98469.1 Homeodomain protein [Pseudocohnilembus persalinus]
MAIIRKIINSKHKEQNSQISRESEKENNIWTFKKQRQKQEIKQKLSIKQQKLANKDFIRGSYKKYSNDDRQEAIDLYNKSKDFMYVSKQLDIPAKNIRRWVKQGPNRKKGGGRRTKDIEMEKKLHKWIIQQFSTQNQATRKQIQEKAMEITQFKNSFKASKGWMEKFLQRFQQRFIRRRR